MPVFRLARVLTLTCLLALNYLAAAEELQVPDPPVAPSEYEECSRFRNSVSGILDALLDQLRATELRGDQVKVGSCCARANPGNPWWCTRFESVAAIAEQVACVELRRDEAVKKCREEVRLRKEEKDRRKNDADKTKDLKDYARQLESEARKQIVQAYKDALKYALQSPTKERREKELRTLEKRALQRVDKLNEILSSDISSRTDALASSIDSFMEDMDSFSREFDSLALRSSVPAPSVYLNRVSKKDKKPSSEGLFAVRYKGKWGYTDSFGTFVIPPVFDEAYAFVDGQAKVEHDGSIFTINTAGNRVDTSRATSPQWMQSAQTPAQANRIGSKNFLDRGILIILDTSESMDGSKLEAAKAGAQEAIATGVGKGIQFKVVTFSGECSDPIRIVHDWSTDVKSVTTAIESLHAGGGTPLAPALEQVAEMMGREVEPGKGAVVLLADGENNCGDVGSALARMSSKGLRFHHETIGLQVSGTAEADLRRIADATGGNYTPARDIGSVSSAFRQSFHNLRRFILDWERIKQ